MLEKMNEFFNNRIEGYETHMMNNIANADEFYPFTASLLPLEENVKIIDLGCGTGLELSFYFEIGGKASFTCIDMSEGMLRVLEEKFKNKNLNILKGSYFDLPFEKEYYGAAISVESLHHFTKEEKIPLYKKLHSALKENGFFILTDYFAPSDEAEKALRQELASIKTEQGIEDNEFYHFDTPLTVSHEIEALINAGFNQVEVLGHWENTYTLKASK